MKSNDVIVFAYNKGYRVNNNGDLVSPTGIKRKLRKTPHGYFETNIRIGGKMHHLILHKLVAYQKFGERLFACDCVRHLDGNPLNNVPENIAIGSLSDNMLDIPKEIRIKRAAFASTHQENYRNNKIVKDIKRFYSENHSYKKTMEAFDISSKGTLFYILHNR